jgi:hypothetical protein
MAHMGGGCHCGCSLTANRPEPRLGQEATTKAPPKQPSDSRLQFLRLAEEHLSEGQIGALEDRIAARHGLGPFRGQPVDRLREVLLRAVTQQDARRYRKELERRRASQ